MHLPPARSLTRTTRFTTAAFLLLSAVMILAGTLAKPMVTLQTHTPEGTAPSSTSLRGAVVELTDPTVPDRMMAGLSSVSLAFFTILFAGMLVAIGLDSVRHVKFNKSVVAALSGAATGLGVLTLAVSFTTPYIQSWYFGDSLGSPISATMDTTGNGAALILMGFVTCLGVWSEKLEQKDRADDLDVQLQDVV
ncbi:hypothetical protein [Streptomyces sp. NPDC088727]|uniref:hypothetical protein n=1 Tax=Streptomyces sp. NPDC088727 TaxID=3365875 RepID=UPI0037F5CE0C